MQPACPRWAGDRTGEVTGAGCLAPELTICSARSPRVFRLVRPDGVPLWCLSIVLQMCDTATLLPLRPCNGLAATAHVRQPGGAGKTADDRQARPLVSPANYSKSSAADSTTAEVLRCSICAWSQPKRSCGRRAAPLVGHQEPNAGPLVTAFVLRPRHVVCLSVMPRESVDFCGAELPLAESKDHASRQCRDSDDAGACRDVCRSYDVIDD